MGGDGKVALVTGAGRGIGAEVARQLGHHGFTVIVTARDLGAAQPISDALIEEGMRARPLQLDIVDADSIDALERGLDGQPLDLLVNNAAAFADWTEMASTADLPRARQVMDTNLFGTWGLIQALLPAMKRSDHARIVNVGSGSGSFGDPMFGLTTNPAAVSYAISKAALHALTIKLAVELASDGIDVVAVDPGLTATAPGMESMGARPVAEGAASVVAAATGAGITNGTFTRDQQILTW